MTTVKILKSERAIISESLADWLIEHSFTDIEEDTDDVELNIHVDRPAQIWHAARYCQERLKLKKDEQEIKETV